MISIQHLGVPMTSWRSLVTSCPESEFASGGRSTLPLLEFWRDPQHALDQMREKLGVALQDPSVMFEHKTPVRDGRGKASHTDLMIDASDVAVAIEAKFSEPPYESVAEWSGLEPTENRKAVLGGWLRMITDRSGVEVAPAQVQELPYQLIHRAASACAMSRKLAIVAYHLFGGDDSQYYRNHLKALAGMCPSDAIRFVVLETRAARVPEFAALVNRLVGDASRAALVREAMLREPIYSFGETVATQVM